MKMSEDVKGFLGKMPFIPMSTQGKDGPHLIVVGKGIVIDDETVAFFGWRQSRTSENIRNNGVVQIAVVSEQKNSGYRLAGKGRIETEGRIYASLKEKFPEQLGKLGFVTVMKVEQIEPLI